MPITRRLISAAAAMFVVTAGLTVPTSSALAVPGTDPSLTVTDLSGNPASSVANGAALPVTATAPITSPGQTGQSIQTTWDAGKASVTPSSIVTPEGWTKQYTTDGTTWSATQPGNAATISGIRASGNVSSNGITNGLQVSTATGTGTVQVSAGNFQGSSGGDGWDAFDAGSQVLNVWHHNTVSYNLDCHAKVDGSSCGGVYTVNGYTTSGASTGNYYGGKVYSYLGNNTTRQFGVMCTDVSARPFTSCGFTPLVTATGMTYSYLGRQVLYGSRLYVPITNPAAELLCFDIATQSGCAQQPYALTGMTGLGSVPAFSVISDGKLFVTGSSVFCFDAATAAPCAGSWPVAVSSNYSTVAPRYDATGVLVGVCQVYGTYRCWDLTGAATAAPAGLTSALSANSQSQMVGWSQPLTANHRFYWFSTNYSTYLGVNNCYDWATDALCTGFTPHSLNASRYAMRLDSANPNCIWHNGDNGQIGSFDATTGAAGCTSPYPIVSIPYTNVVPRLSCSEAGRVRSWNNITFSVPAGVDVTGLKMTVNDAFGNSINGFADLQPNAAGQIDLSTLPVSATGTQPTFLVKVIGATNTQAAQLTAAVQYASDPPQVCYNLTVKHNCPSLTPGLSSGPTVPADALTVNGSAVATVGTVDTPTALATSVTQADAMGCVGAVAGTATRQYSGGSVPLPNATVELVAPDSSVVGTTMTDGNGGYSFANVNPAAYQVRIGGQQQAANVLAAGSATANIGVPVVDPAASDVSSQTVQNTPTTFATSVTTDPTTSVDPAGLRFLDPSTSSYVSALTVAGEGVWTATASGNLVFSPALGFTGQSTSVTYQVADLYGTKATAHASVTVLAVLPTAKAARAEGVQGDVLTLTPQAQSSAVALDAASLRLIDPATGARVLALAVAGVGTYSVDVASGKVGFVPAPSFTGADTEVYQVLDALGRTATSTLTVVLAPLAPTGASWFGASGTTGTGVATGIPDGSILSVPAGVDNASSVTVSGSTIQVVPAPGFAGVITVPVTVSHGATSVITMMTFEFAPAAAGVGHHTITRSGTSVVSWKPSASTGVTYLVRVNGRVVCSTTKTSCTLPSLLGPKAVVKVVATVQGVARSAERRLPYKFTGCVAAGAAHFDTASADLLTDTKARITAFAQTLKAQGFAHVCLTGYTDSRASVDYNRALSLRRVHAVGHYLGAWVKGSHMQKVGVRMAYLGEYYPASTNNSDAGRAANRRVTLGLG